MCRWEGTPRSAQDNGVALGLVCERWGVCEKGVHVRVRVGVFALPWLGPLVGVSTVGGALDRKGTSEAAETGLWA